MCHLITLERSTSTAPSGDRRGRRRDRADFLAGRIAGAGFVAGGVLFNGFASPAEAAISTRSGRSERRQDRQLRADARVPRGRVLRAGGRQRRGHDAASRTSPRSSPRTRPRTSRRSSACSARGGQEAEVRLRRRRHEPRRSRRRAQVLEDTGVRPTPARARTSCSGRSSSRGPLDPLGRGAPRGVDPLHQLRGGLRAGHRQHLPAPTAFDALQREGGPEGRHGDGLHQGLASGAGRARASKRVELRAAARRRARRSRRRVSVCMRSVPNASTLNEASAVP